MNKQIIKHTRQIPYNEIDYEDKRTYYRSSSNEFAMIERFIDSSENSIAKQCIYASIHYL